MFSPTDIFYYFGSAFCEERGDDVIIGGINTEDLLADITAIWKNSKLALNMFKEIRKHRIVVDKFFLPDVQYIFNQIYEFKQRSSTRYRIKKVIELIDTETWMKSTVEEHPDILDFTQLKNLKHTLFDHQITTLKVYNEKVPKMQLKGFLLSTPPGCITGDATITLRRGGERFNMFMEMAARCYNQDGNEFQNWDLSIPTYVRAFTGNGFDYQEVHSIVYSGKQEVYLVRLSDGKPITCTRNHLIMTEDGYVPAWDIVGKKVMCNNRFSVENLAYREAISCEYFGYEETYDVICKEPWHNFIANDIVIHNSGKTIMSIALSQCLHADISIYIVPKNTVTTVWFDGIVEELGPKAKVWASSHDVPMTADYDHYIFHYEALPLAIYLAKLLAGKRKKPFIAIDEAHNLNEITSVRTLRLVELTQMLNCQHTVFASGTPIKALGTEAIPLLRCIDPFFTQRVEDRFKAIYGLTAKRANDILRNRLGLISHKISESSYMTAPKPIEIALKIKVPNGDRFSIANIQAEMKSFMTFRYKFYESNMKQYINIFNRGLDIYEKGLNTSQQRADLKKYKDAVALIIKGYDPVAHKAEAAFCKEFEKTKILPALPVSIRNQFKDSISIVKYVKLRVLGEALAVVGRKRAECASELGEYGNLDKIVLEADKKSIIFSSYIEALESTYNLFISKRFNALRIYGDFTKRLTELVMLFKKDASVNPLLGTLQSLAASQTLTNANVVIFLNHPFREYIRDQAFHRVFRIGQDTQTYIYMCELDTGDIPNISTHTSDILAWSQAQVEAIVGAPLTEKQMDGIVSRLHLNQNASIFSGATQLFKDIIGI